MDLVKIIDGKKEVSLPVQNGILKLSFVQRYFVGATGLTFTFENEKCGVDIKNDEVQLVKNVTSYDVYYPANTCGMYCFIINIFFSHFIITIFLDTQYSL